jgi:hypothetical protein
MRLFTVEFFALLLGFSLLSCGGSKKNIDETAGKLPKVKEEMLINTLDSLSKQKPQHFYSKISSRYADKDLKVSFKTSVRMTADSALQATITFARIPIYNALVTPDTLTIVDKRNNCFLIEDMSYLKKTFDVDFQHHNLEEVLLGMPVGWESDEDYYQIKDPYHYIVSSHNKRSLRRSSKEITGDVYIKYYLDQSAKSIKRMVIDSPADTTVIDIRYLSREMVEGFLLPAEADVHIYTPRDTIFIDLKYTKTSVNDPRTIYIGIPEKYERCQ